MAKKSQIEKWKRKAVAFIVAAVTALLALVGSVAYFGLREDSSMTSGKPQSGETVTVEGEYECLPKPEGPQTMECAFGVNANGTHYGLDFTQMDESPPVWTQLQIGDRIRVTGVYDERKTIYLSPGVIIVESAEAL